MFRHSKLPLFPGRISPTVSKERADGSTRTVLESQTIARLEGSFAQLGRDTMKRNKTHFDDLEKQKESYFF
jgi:hypothetical protein